MKVCGLSDLHGNFIDIPECDVLCICGDIVGLVEQRSIEQSRHWWYNRFTSWVNRLPCKKVIITPGNHDFFLEDAYKKGYLEELRKDLSARTNGKLEILINSEYTYEGIKFYGCPFIRPIKFQMEDGRLRMIIMRKVIFVVMIIFQKIQMYFLLMIIPIIMVY